MATVLGVKTTCALEISFSRRDSPSRCLNEAFYVTCLLMLFINVMVLSKGVFQKIQESDFTPS